MGTDRPTASGSIFIPTEDDLTPVDGTPIQQLSVRSKHAANNAKQAATSAEETRTGVRDLRGEFRVALDDIDKSFVQVDARFDKVETKVDTLGDHVSDLREKTAEMGSHVEHILRIVRKDQNLEEKRAEAEVTVTTVQQTTAIVTQAEGVKHRRWISRKLLGLLAAVGGSGGTLLLHHFFG